MSRCPGLRMLVVLLKAIALALHTVALPAPQSGPTTGGFSVQWLGSWRLAGCGGANKTCIHEPWPSALPERGASPSFHRRVFLFGQGLGHYPFVNISGGMVNGGLPQSPEFNLSSHLLQVRADLLAFASIADPAPGSLPDDRAYCCIDWEAAYPMLELGSNEHNMNMSMALARRGSPTATDAELAQIAVREFNGAVQRLWLETLTTAQEVVSACNWGFYGLPRIFLWAAATATTKKHCMTACYPC